jgi:acyl-CoA synthetase (AMP-forming)/AMP-acid ligase II/thioesterase domain-containing protein/acyl carrier protein
MDRPTTVFQMLSLWAGRSPSAPAIVAEEREALSHGALLEQANAVREALNDCGIGRGDRVAMVMPGGPELAACVTVIAACAVAAPLNPDYTIAEFAYFLSDLGARAVIVLADAETPARAAAEQLDIPVIELHPEPDGPAGAFRLVGGRLGEGRAGTASEPGPAESGDTALLLYTSGTGSRGKIVPTSHAQLLARLGDSARLFELGPDDLCLNLMPLYHGHGLYNGLFAPLFAGGGSICAPGFEAESFFRWLHRLAPTWYTGSYSFHHAVLSHAAAHGDAIERCRLRFIRSGSGRLDPAIARGLEAAFGVPVIETYSTTETGLICGNPQPPAERKLGTVGPPVGGEVALMGDGGEVRRPGEAGAGGVFAGEIMVRGPHVFDGYENEPGINEVAFVDGWFRTGDLGSFDADGYLTIVGRFKETINRGGEKITPSEIDAVLMRHPDVESAVAFAIPHATLGEQVAAAIVPRRGAVVAEKELGRLARKHLAAFKAPRKYVFVEAIPKGPTGKVRRNTLAVEFGLDRPARRAPAAAADRQPTPLEARLSVHWASILGLDSVGLGDDFFLLGGDSLRAVELFLEIEKDIGRRLPRSILFEAGTVEEMARLIVERRPHPCIVPIQPGGGLPPFYCVHDGNGDVLNFRDLARRLGDEQPFYGIQSVGLDSDDVPCADIEDMAAHYVSEIRAMQPEGPYFFGGYSFGGRVAYVMAQQLRAAGAEVGMLALLDSYCRVGRSRIGLGGWLRRHTGRLSELKASQVPAYLLRRVGNLAVMMAMSARLAAFAAAWRYCERRGRAVPKFLRRVEDANTLARRNYRAATYDGDAVLFKARLYAWTHPDAHDGWSRLIRGRLQVRPIPGYHYDIMKEPHVGALARELKESLSAARSG